jgi:hypothetical protein
VAPGKLRRHEDLVVGSGGVGSGFAPIAARVDASDPDSVAEIAKANGCDAILNAVDPLFVAGSSRAPSAPARPTSTWRCRSPSPTRSNRMRRTAGSSATISSPPPRPGRTRAPRARGLWGVARALRRLRALCRRPLVPRHRRVWRAGRGRPEGGGLRLPPRLLDLDDDRGVPEPTRDLGEGSRLVHHLAFQPARDPSCSRTASTRSSASTSSTRSRRSTRTSSSIWLPAVSGQAPASWARSLRPGAVPLPVEGRVRLPLGDRGARSRVLTAGVERSRAGLQHRGPILATVAHVPSLDLEREGSGLRVVRPMHHP